MKQDLLRHTTSAKTLQLFASERLSLKTILPPLIGYTAPYTSFIYILISYTRSQKALNPPRHHSSWSSKGGRCHLNQAYEPALHNSQRANILGHLSLNEVESSKIANTYFRLAWTDYNTPSSHQLQLMYHHISYDERFDLIYIYILRIINKINVTTYQYDFQLSICNYSRGKLKCIIFFNYSAPNRII